MTDAIDTIQKSDWLAIMVRGAWRASLVAVESSEHAAGSGM